MARHHKSILKLIRKYTPYPTCGVEVGVYLAETVTAIHKHHPQCHLTLVDPWAPYAGRAKTLSKCTTVGSMEFHTAEQWGDVRTRAMDVIRTSGGPSTVLEMTSEHAANITTGPFDFVFLDAVHSYEGVRQDIELWAPKARLLMGHDYNGVMDKQGFRGVKRAVDEVFGARVVCERGLVWAVVM